MTGAESGGGSAALLIDSLKAADRQMAKAQSRRAQLMVQFADTRKKADRHRIAELESEGADPRYQAGEFAATEIGLAVTTTKPKVERLVAMSRRLQSETPDVWDAWIAGDINQLKAEKVNHALLKLVRDDSKRVLNTLVVPVAITKTPELLGRWLNQFVAQAEPDESDERIRRSLDDRYASVRPDLDGVSFLSACMSSLDAASVDLLLEALAGSSVPGDPRTKAQLRADALVDLLLGRISNGWHGPTCGYGDGGETDDDGCRCPACMSDGSGSVAPDPDAAIAVLDTDTDTETDADPDPVAGADLDANPDWNDDADWDLPASAFRPDPRNEPSPDPVDDTNTGSAGAVSPAGEDRSSEGSSASGAGIRSTNCQGRPVPRVTIGVVVSAQSLLGFTDTPGQLADRSALVPAAVIRELAALEGTLFYRLLTDPAGNLLDVTEMGRFPSRKLTAALRFRDGVCAGPICHAAAQRCDLDHAVPWPEGPTAAWNVGPKCRNDHRAKTHAGFDTTMRDGQTVWTTPTGHRYVNDTDPLPVEDWPDTG